MTEAKRPVDQALDLLVYAPLGLAFSARQLIPELAERGRQQLASQVVMARLVGQFAVKQGTVEAERALLRAREQAMARLGDLFPNGNGDAPAPPPDVEPSTEPGDVAPAPEVPVDPEPPAQEPFSGGRPTWEQAPRPPGAGPGVSVLAIPDYDSLSASQVVPRLSGLAPAELERVRAYEAAHRGRRTILTRVTQLQSGL